jgi:sterol desaturase/sphingolipid hydroxylase (fatty acid hydroxylase superfamily)
MDSPIDIPGSIDSALQQLLAFKGVLVVLWLALALALEQWRPAALPPLGLAGYGAAWFARWGRNLALFVLGAALSSLLVLPVTIWAASLQLWTRPAEVPALLWPLIDIVLLDLWLYWWHRANHEVPFLWRFHEVHHRDRHLDATSALRFHFGELFLSSLVRAAIIVALAVPLQSVLIFETLVLVAAIFHHANWRLPAGFEAALARVVITPSRHWVHHHRVRADTDSTYGTIFSFWDPLFRTTTPTRRTQLMPIGVEGRDEVDLIALIGLPSQAPAPEPQRSTPARSKTAPVAAAAPAPIPEH